MLYVNDGTTKSCELRDTENPNFIKTISTKQFRELASKYKILGISNTYNLIYPMPLYLTYPYSNFIYTNSCSKGIFADMGYICKTGKSIQSYDNKEMLDVHRNLKRSPLMLNHKYKLIGKTGIFGGVKLRNEIELHGFPYLPIRMTGKSNNTPYIECVKTLSDFTQFNSKSCALTQVFTLNQLVDAYTNWVNLGGEAKLEDELKQWYLKETNYTESQIKEEIHKHFILSPIRKISDTKYELSLIREEVKILDLTEDSLSKTDKLRLRLAYGDGIYDTVKADNGVLDYCEYNFMSNEHNASVNVALPYNIHTLTKNSVRIMLPTYCYNSNYTIKFPSTIKSIDIDFLKTKSYRVYLFDISELDRSTQIEFMSICFFKGWWRIKSNLDGADFIQFLLQLNSFTRSKVYSKQNTLQHIGDIPFITKYNSVENAKLLDEVLQVYFKKCINIEKLQNCNFNKLKPIENITTLLHLITTNAKFQYISQIRALFDYTFDYTNMVSANYQELEPRLGTYFLLNKIFNDKLPNIFFSLYTKHTIYEKPTLQLASNLLQYCLGSYYNKTYAQEIFITIDKLVLSNQNTKEFQQLKQKIYGDYIPKYSFCYDFSR